MKFVLVVIFLFLSISSFSQRLISGQAYGTTSAEEGMKMIHTKDNGYLFVGRTYYPGNSRYFAKLDSNFNLLWQKRVPDYGYFIWDIIENEDSEFVTVGDYYYNANTNISTTCPFYQVLDKKCDTLWSRRYYSYGSDYSFYKIAQLSNLNFLIFGYFPLKTKNLLIISKLGDTISTSNINSYAMLALKDTFIIASHYYFRKFTNSGQSIFYRGLNLKCNIEKAYLTIDKEYVLLGNGINLSRINSVGDTIWSRFYNEYDIVYAADIKQTLDSGFLALGTIDGDIYLLKTDKNGNKQWSYILERPFGTETAYGLALNCDSSIHIFEDATNGQIGGKDLYVLKMDSMKNVYGACALRTGVEEVDYLASNIKISPNPFFSEFSLAVKKSTASDCTVRIYDLTGREMFSKNYFLNNEPLNISPEIPDGFYILKVFAGEKMYTQKIVKSGTN